jgi:predicted DsbA family dithiol-disulfide isomerase
VADVGTVSITYVTDPFCPWSWAAEPSWRRLEAEFAGQLAITYVISGMGGAQPDAREWLEASAESGMPADPRGVLEEPPASTNPAGLAVKAVAEQADPGPFLRRLREAIFVERRRVDRGDALLDVARERSLGLNLDTLRIAFGSHGPVEALGADFERAAGRPRPSLGIGDAVLDGRAPYDEWRAAVVVAGGEPVGARLDVEGALRRFGRMATPEVAAVCELPGPLAAAQLEIHERRLAEYDELHAGAGDWPAGPRLALESGIGHEREWVRFWRTVTGA